MCFVVVNMFVRRMGIIISIIYLPCHIKDHNNTLKGDMEGSYSSYAIRSKCAIKLSKFLKYKFMKKLETML
jgi:hypothetical protein